MTKKKIHDLPAEARRKLTERYPGLAAERLGLSAAIHQQQTAWPAECPLSEPELRGEIRALLDGLKALQDRAEALYARLPDPPDAEIEGEMPQSIYGALTDAASMAGGNTPEILKYLDSRLRETPESLCGEWLGEQLERCGGLTGDPGAARALLTLARALATAEDEDVDPCTARQSGNVGNVEAREDEGKGRKSAREAVENEMNRGTLTLKDLSFVLDTESSMPEDVQARVRRDILGDPRYSELFEHAEQMRRDAGTAELWEAMACGVDLEQLLDAEGWDDPAEILMPGEEDTSCLGHRELIRLASARISRGEHPDRLLAVKERVARAECKLPEKALEELVELVRRLSPESAARMVARASELLDQALG